MDLVSDPAQNLASGYLSTNQDHFASQSYNIHSSQFTSDCTSPVANIVNAPTAKAQSALPKVGQTRCYWTLLTTSLQFSVLDPVLEYHLQDQAANFLECGLLDFVHPDEREIARRDLGNVLAERTLHGSVTRVRYHRLSRIRRLLGMSDGSLPYPPSFPAERIAIDADYMAVYLVVNCVADGVVLCFIHAVVDIAPQADNDELRKTGWSNWCSTYGFDQGQAHALYQRLCEIAIPIPRDLGDPCLRVLQIFRNQPDRALVLSWPPDSALFQDGFIVSVADNLAQLAQHVQLGYSMGRGSNDDARTSCTRRYKSVQTIKLPTVEGLKIVQVESILIPHGTIIFTCHKVNGAYLDAVHSYSSLTDTQNHQEEHKTCGVEVRETGDPRDHSRSHSIQTTSQHDLLSHNFVREWVARQSHAARQDNHACDERRGIQPSTTTTTTSPYSNFNFTDAANMPPQNHWDNGYHVSDRCHSVSTPMSEAAVQSSTVADMTSNRETTAAFTLSAGLSTTRTIEEDGRKSRSPSNDAEAPSGSSKDRIARERISIGGKAQGNPPVGVLSCAHCQISHSPEWRRGPSGKKDLCNACGLRYSRSRAKKEGIVSRKRKNKRDEVPPLSKQHSLSRLSNAWSDSIVITTVPQSHNRISPGLDAGAYSSAFSIMGTSHSVQMPYFTRQDEALLS